MNGARCGVLLLVLGTSGTLATSCSQKRASGSGENPDTPTARLGPAFLPPSPDARLRLEELRARFVLAESVDRRGPSSARAPSRRSVLGPSVAARFVDTADGHAHAVFDRASTVLTPASVALAGRADGDVSLEDDRTHVALKFRLRGASAAGLAVADGLALYTKALDGADLVHKPRPDGTEDFVAFESRPAREELAYDVDVSRVAGLRLVSNALEFLDASGTPRLRIAPPYVVDATGARHAATLAVAGCAYDTNPAAPWDRPVTAPGASSCGVRVTWTSDVYPVIVDPVWTTTGSMSMGRVYHTATKLATNKVLIAGGLTNGPAGSGASAELFDGTSAFAMTGSMSIERYQHTATSLPSGKVLITGGVPGGTASAELFDGTSTFGATGALKTAREGHTATLLASGKVLIAGGSNGGGTITTFLSSAELFNGTSTFAFTGSMNAPRQGHVAAALPNGKVLIAGGINDAGTGPGPTSSAEIFDGTSAFTPTGSMASQRSTPVAAVLANGKVLVSDGLCGGCNPELFDGTSAFATTAPMTIPRQYATMTTLAAGRVVLVAGGVTNNGGPLWVTEVATTELFDGTSNFAATGSMNVTRQNHSATLLASGKVLVTGGNGYLASAELYALVSPGGTCTYGNECTSGVCDDGICCAGVCGGSCQTCTPGTGACIPVKSAVDPDTCSGTQSCDATGVCRLANGQPSVSPVACASGYVSDGVCCNAACSGPCDACAVAAGAAVDGTCKAVAQGSPGNPACGTGYACDGVAATCPSPCVGDLDCAAGYYCAANGACTPQLAQGHTCNLAAGADCKAAGCHACATGNCVDGVCCENACGSTCSACAAALKEYGPDGTCGPVSLNRPPPRGTCPVSPSDPCGPSGKCNGASACLAFALVGSPCGATSCNGTNVNGSTCNGSGTCVSGSSVDCTPYACTGGACTTSCTTDGDCVRGTAYCNAKGACTPKANSGAACTAGNECASGFCVDGFCCNVACDGQCEACNVLGSTGTCTAVPGAPVGGRPACGGQGTPCAGRCDGTTGAVCSYVDGTPCGSSCSAGQQIDMRCNLAGACVAFPAKACLGNIAACDGDVCKASCTVDGDCTPGNGCAAGKCVPLAASCDGAHTVKAPNGTTTDCSPYNCEGDHCKLACASINDCTSGSVCNAEGHCIDLSAPSPSAEQSGCTVEPGGPGGPGGPAGSRSPGGFAAVILAVAGAVARRRKRERTFSK